MEFLNKKQKLLLGIIISIMMIFIGHYILNKTNDSEYLEFEEEFDSDEIKDSENIINEEKIKVHIIGEVHEEGIIEIDNKSRIADVIEEAGGATEEADLSKVNLAYEVKDGQKIYIPSVNEELENEYITSGAGKEILQEEGNKMQEKVNINTAKQTELETLNGIGPSTALKIINYRNENGEFKSIEEIKNVPGIGESKFKNIEDDICI